MLYQRDESAEMMAKRQEHCYTNPSFCQQSEYIPEDRSSSDASDLPPPPQFQMDDLPPPPAILAPQPQYGQSNPGFTGSPETELQQRPPVHHRSIASNLNRTTADRYCYIDDPADQEPSPPPVISHKRYGSLPMGRQAPYRLNRYEYIQDAPVHQGRYEYLEHQQLQQRAAPTPGPPPPLLPQQQQQQQQVVMMSPARTSYRSSDTHYTSLGNEGVDVNQSHWVEQEVYNRRQISTPKGRYTSVPMQEDYGPPSLPERNDAGFQQQQQQQQRVNQATQKLHEILTTPRKPRKRTQSEALSPIKSPQMQPMLHGVQRNAYTPTHSPSSNAGHRMAAHSPMQQLSPQRSALSPSRSIKGPTTSTPNKEPLSPHQQQQLQQPSARRCLPLNESGTPMIRRHIEDTQTYGRSPRAYSVAEEAMYVERKKHQFYNSGVEEAFIARTAVVPPLSPPMSEANTTLVSGTYKSDRKYAPVLVVLVGVLTCGLAVYFSTQGRKYYYDSAFICGSLCALAGASRSLRRTWTSLSLAGLSALSCAGLLLLAGVSPPPGAPLHDMTAGALCGVSMLGAVLAFLALVSPRCPFGRHHRVHSWIPAFAP